MLDCIALSNIALSILGRILLCAISLSVGAAYMRHVGTIWRSPGTHD
jgi:hypothetical protein